MEDDEPVLGFHEMGLDDRILQAIARLKWASPTLIQEKAIPLALEGKDLLARARTGSGKTGAFAVPCVQRILSTKRMSTCQEVHALVLAPTRELCRQLCACFQSLTACCSREVRCVNVGTQEEVALQRPVLLRKPDIVVGTPSRVLAHIRATNLDLSTGLKMLVVDEADLMVTFGHGADLKEIVRHLPGIYQTFLMSATVSEHVKELRQMLLHNPVILKLEEPQLPTSDQLSQYHIKIEEKDKFLLIYTLFKLKLIHGKTIIFVNKVDRCYKLKLFLEQFGIPSCALNSELPANCRSHIVSQFNDGTYDIIVASDERFLDGSQPAPGQDEASRSKRRPDPESGVARGIDFQFVSNVINFDFPRDVDAYVHRAGRTARGCSKGSALSFVSGQEQPLLDLVVAKLAEMFPGEQQLFKPYQVRLKEMEGFRYRAQDAMRAVTKRAIREARLKEIKQEIFNSKQLQAFFEENPGDMQLLRHDRALHTAKVQKHMKHVPEYIVPKSLRRRAAVTASDNAKQASAASQPRRQHKRKREPKSASKDPLKSLKFTGFDEEFR